MLKRATESFSRLPMDLILEKTLKADTACQRKGFLTLTNSVSAGQRWGQGHFICTSVSTNLSGKGEGGQGMQAALFISGVPLMITMIIFSRFTVFCSEYINLPLSSL